MLLALDQRVTADEVLIAERHGEPDARLERVDLVVELVAGEDQAGLDPETIEFEAACFGMSGGPDDKREILAAILEAAVDSADAPTE